MTFILGLPEWIAKKEIIMNKKVIEDALNGQL